MNPQPIRETVDNIFLNDNHKTLEYLHKRINFNLNEDVYKYIMPANVNLQKYVYEELEVHTCIDNLHYTAFDNPECCRYVFVNNKVPCEYLCQVFEYCVDANYNLYFYKYIIEIVGAACHHVSYAEDIEYRTKLNDIDSYQYDSQI